MTESDRPAPDPQPAPHPEPAPRPGDGGEEGEEDERLRILRLVAAGRITAAEGADLLAALDPPPVPPGPPSPQPAGQPWGPWTASWKGGRVAWTQPVPGPGPVPSFGPVPPVPPVPPAPPVPPVGPFMVSAPPVPGAKQVIAASAARKAAAGWWEPQTLVIYATDGEGEVNVRLPLGLAMSSTTRFLSKRVRERLEHHEIDLDEILKHAGALMGSGAPQQLVYVTDEEGELRITLE
jgi:hypothetical protein